MKYAVGILYRNTLNGQDAYLWRLVVRYQEADSEQDAIHCYSLKPNESYRSLEQYSDEYGRIMAWEQVRVIGARKLEENDSELFSCYLDSRDHINSLLIRPPLLIHPTWQHRLIWGGCVLLAIIILSGSLRLTFAILFGW